MAVYQFNHLNAQSGDISDLNNYLLNGVTPGAPPGSGDTVNVGQGPFPDMTGTLSGVGTWNGGTLVAGGDLTVNTADVVVDGGTLHATTILGIQFQALSGMVDAGTIDTDVSAQGGAQVEADLIRNDGQFGLTATISDDADVTALTISSINGIDIHVLGTGSTLDVTNLDSVAHSGHASTIDITDAGHLSVGPTFKIGERANETVTVSIEDLGSQFVFTGNLIVGDDGAGVLNIRDGAHQTLDGLIVGSVAFDAAAGNTGLVDVTGTDTLLDVTTDVVVSGVGRGSLVVSNDAEMTVGGTLLTNNASSTGVTVSSGGKLTVTGLTTIAEEGVDVASQVFGGGIFEALGGMVFAATGPASTNRASFFVQDDGSILRTLASDVTIGAAGRATVNIFGGADFDASGGTVIIGDEAGSQGTLSIGFLGVNPPTPPATEGATMTAQEVIVGHHGSGSFTIRGGESDVTINGDILIGDAAEGSGSVGVRDGGMLTVEGVTVGAVDGFSSTLTVEGNSVAHARNSTLTFNQIIDVKIGSFNVQNGGEATGTGIGAAVDVGLLSGENARLDVTSNGKLQTNDLNVGGAGVGIATIQSGGSIEVAEGLHIDATSQAGNRIVVGASALQLDSFSPGAAQNNSHLLVSGAAIIDGSGTAGASGGLWIARGASATFESTLTVNPLGVIALIDQGKLDLAGGGSLTIADGGTLLATAGGGRVTGVNVEDDGLMQARASSTLELKDVNLIGTGELQILDQAKINIDGAVAASLSVNFAGSQGTLELVTPQDFLATIQDFDVGDKIHLIDDIAVSLNVNATQLNVTLVNATAVHFTLDQTVNENALRISSDGGSGSNIILTNLLTGTAGNDTLNMTALADTADGLGGTDLASYASANAGVTANLANPSLNTGAAADDGYISIEGLVGSNFADTLTGDGGANLLKGQSGNDTLSGAAGMDTLTGGRGKDFLTGGADRDTFDFNSIKESAKGGNRDQILDFNRSEHDRIDLKSIDANTHKHGNQKFDFIGSHKFSKVEGELRCKNHVIQADVDGNGKADFEIHSNLSSMHKGDFIL